MIGVQGTAFDKAMLSGVSNCSYEHSDRAAEMAHGASKTAMHSWPGTTSRPGSVVRTRCVSCDMHIVHDPSLMTVGIDVCLFLRASGPYRQWFLEDLSTFLGFCLRA
eukprot:4557638-Amphidinium_carterae.1